ncbi:MAG TPA: ribosome maturation factor RimM [Terriglobales bacterium]|nr:ribosome maturation factor RimM [Terriglobales bacterium]
MGDDFITLARVVKTQGRRGEVAVEPHTVIPDRFAVGMRLFVLGETNRRRELEIEDAWPHKGLLVLKFRGVDSISDAEPLLRCELQVPLQERAPLEAGWTYISELNGCTVFDGPRKIGSVEDVKFGAGEAPLLIVRGAGRMLYEIPYAEAYLAGVDLDGKQIRMRLPEGMLEINAPLTDQEKREKQ